MKLTEPFAFRDTAGTVWQVPAGAIVNGASIPRALWTLVGPPFVGDYRRASVVHDYFCLTKSRPSREVHRMFYEASIVDGTDPKQAAVMYAAVRRYGPRWRRARHMERPRANARDTPDFYWETSPLRTREFDEAEFDAMAAWIEATNPSREEIDDYLAGLSQ